MDLKQPPNAVNETLRTYRIRTRFDRRFASALYGRLAYGFGWQRRLNALLAAAVEQRTADEERWADMRDSDPPPGVGR